MFRYIANKKNKLVATECINLLKSASYGVISVNGDGGFPYAVPVNLVYYCGVIYFFGSQNGHKGEAILRDGKVSLNIVSKNEDISPITAEYNSVIVFGKILPLFNETKVKAVIDIFAEKYACEKKYKNENDALRFSLAKKSVFELKPEHISGKKVSALIT